MKKLVLSMLILFTALSLNARKRYVGIYLGDMTGINLVLPSSGFDLNIYTGFSNYWYRDNSIRTDVGLRIIHKEFTPFNQAVFPNNPESRLYYYIIPAVMFSFTPWSTTKIGIGSEVAFGLNFPIQNFDIFWDITPGIIFFPPVNPYISGGIGVRMPF